MAVGDLSPKHRIAHGSVALESGREVERSRRTRVFCRECGAGNRTDSPFLWVSAAASGSYTRRRDRHRGIFAINGWRYEFVLEEQSLSDAGVHRRERRAASTVGVSRFGELGAGERNSNRVG